MKTRENWISFWLTYIAIFNKWTCDEMNTTHKICGGNKCLLLWKLDEVYDKILTYLQSTQNKMKKATSINTRTLGQIKSVKKIERDQVKGILNGKMTRERKCVNIYSSIKKKKLRRTTDHPNACNLEIENSSTELNFLAAKYGFWLSHVVQPCEFTLLPDI